MKLQEISAEKFRLLDPSQRIISHDHARRFALLELDLPAAYGLSWRSEGISPLLELSQNAQRAWLGVDQQVAAINLLTGEVLLKLPFHSHILNIVFGQNVTIVVTDIDFSVFNADLSLRLVADIPDIPGVMSIDKGIFTVKLINGSTQSWDINEGKNLD